MITKFTKFLNESRLEEYSVIAQGIDFTVKGYFTKGEDEVRYYPDGSGYPGYPDTFDIQEVWTKDDDGILVLADNKLLDYLGVTYKELEEKVLDQISDY